ncbi:MAG: hypothetical protein KAI83_07775, partial [Thiomargarita sp.]|nr:hypothetical protein [Thiomargarita sp.]
DLCITMSAPAWERILDAPASKFSRSHSGDLGTRNQFSPLFESEFSEYLFYGFSKGMNYYKYN